MTITCRTPFSFTPLLRGFDGGETTPSREVNDPDRTNVSERVASTPAGNDSDGQLARTITWDDLRDLAAFEAEKGCAISVYLNLDPTVVPTAADLQSHVNSLLDVGAKSDGANSGELTHDQRRTLRADFDRIRRYIADE